MACIVHVLREDEYHVEPHQILYVSATHFPAPVHTLATHLSSNKILVVIKMHLMCNNYVQGVEATYLQGLNAGLMRRQSCVEAYAEDAQAAASSFGSEKEGSLSKA